MEVKIKATDYQLTNETSEYLDDRIEALGKLVDPQDETAFCEVEIGKATGHHKTGNIWSAEFQIARGSERLRAVAEGATVNAAIDGAKDEMLRQLRQSKGKRAAENKKQGRSFKDWLRFGK